MADTPIRKFLFEHSFDLAAGAVRPPERKPVTLKPEQVDALKKEAYDSGFAAGQKASADGQANQLAATLKRIEERIGQMTENMQSFWQEQEAKARHVALAVARKILPDFTSKGGLQEIQALLTTAISEMVHEPRLVVRVHESQFDAINSNVQDITAQKAYAGKVIVLADAEITSGDCRIEWADGGIERNVEAAMKDIEKVVAPAEAEIPAPKPDSNKE
jgi:flagellar assembly protein FliH